MPAVAGSFFDRHSTRIEELIGQTIELLLPSLDPIWEGLIRTSIDVVPADRWGRDWEIYKEYHGSYAGVIDQGRPYNDIPLHGDATTRLGEQILLQTTPQVWPDPLDGPNPHPWPWKCPMRSQMLNLALTLGEASAEANAGCVGDIIAPKLLGWARNIGHYYCNYWYLSQNQNYRLSTMQNCTVAAAITGGFGWTFTPGNLAVNRFAVGQRVDVWNAAMTVRRNIDTVNGIAGLRVNLMVTKVDKTNATVEVGAAVAPAAWDVAYVPADNDVITYAVVSHAAGAFTGTAGYNSFMKFGDGNGAAVTDANSILGATESIATGRINVNTYPQFKSILRNLGGGPLTSQFLLQFMALWDSAKGDDGQTIDTAIASEGVWLEYYSQIIGRERLMRNDRLATLGSEGMDENAVWTSNGRKLALKTSRWIEANTVVFHKLKGGNFKFHVPPDPKVGLKAKEDNPGIPVRFIAPFLTGTDSIKIPILRTCIPSGQESGTSFCRNAGVTEATMTPAWMRGQLVPEQFAGGKLINVNEDRMFSETGLGISDEAV